MGNVGVSPVLTPWFEEEGEGGSKTERLCRFMKYDRRGCTIWIWYGGVGDGYELSARQCI
jgi:hypothetical protein